jgi:hypothetical protein
LVCSLIFCCQKFSLPTRASPNAGKVAGCGRANKPTHHRANQRAFSQCQPICAVAPTQYVVYVRSIYPNNSPLKSITAHLHPLPQPVTLLPFPSLPAPPPPPACWPPHRLSVLQHRATCSAPSDGSTAVPAALSRVLLVLLCHGRLRAAGQPDLRLDSCVTASAPVPPWLTSRATAAVPPRPTSCTCSAEAPTPLRPTFPSHPRALHRA